MTEKFNYDWYNIGLLGILENKMWMFGMGQIMSMNKASNILRCNPVFFFKRNFFNNIN